MKTVLLVDDEANFLLSLKVGLAASGKQVRLLTAPNGKEALEVMGKTNVDLLVTDIHMPELDGLGLLAKVSQDYPGLPSIVMTAFGSPQVEHKAAVLGAIRYIEKPIEMDEMSRLVFESLEKSAGFLSGIALSSFAQLIEVERKSCLVKASPIDQPLEVGRLWFEAGRLIHADYGLTKGLEAAYVILAWREAKIELEDLSDMMVESTISCPLAQVLMESLVRQDELQRGAFPEEGGESELLVGDGSAGSSVESTGLCQDSAEGKTMAESRTSQVSVILSGMRASVPEIEAMGLVSAEGLVIQVLVPPEWEDRGLDEDQVSAMVSGLVGIAETSSIRFQKKEFQRVTVKAEEGYLSASKVNEECYLFTVTNSKAKLGMVYLAMDEASRALAPVI